MSREAREFWLNEWTGQTFMAIGMQDPDPSVAGGGADALRAAGVAARPHTGTYVADVSLPQGRYDRDASMRLFEAAVERAALV